MSQFVQSINLHKTLQTYLFNLTKTLLMSYYYKNSNINTMQLKLYSYLNFIHNRRFPNIFPNTFLENFLTYLSDLMAQPTYFRYLRGIDNKAKILIINKKTAS